MGFVLESNVILIKVSIVKIEGVSLIRKLKYIKKRNYYLENSIFSLSLKIPFSCGNRKFMLG